MDVSQLMEEERRTREVIEIYRAEHSTWNLERLGALFTDNPTIWRKTDVFEGRAAVEKLMAGWKANAQHTDMYHGRVIVQGRYAAVEWRTIGTAADGSPVDMEGANIYELEKGKIKCLAIYRRR